MSKLQELRTKKGMSQGQLSKETGISIRTLQMYEQGHRDISHAKIDVLLKTCIALDCDLGELITPEFKDLYTAYIGE